MNRITKTELVFFVILFLGLVAVFKFNMIAGGMITSPQDLAEALASPPDSPQDWSMSTWAVVKHRALFRVIVQGTWAHLFNPTDAWGFYATFVVWSFVFFYAALVTLFFYLRKLQFDQRASFIGCLFFLISPPVLLAYKYPVFTREDPLAYFLVTLGLIAAFRSQLISVSVISALAALTRETTMILPLTFFLAAPIPWRKRMLVWILPVLALIGIRVLWGFEAGNNFESSILNFQNAGETIAFLFCVFGLLWLPYVRGLISRWQQPERSNSAWRILTTSGPVILAVVLAATIFLSRAREIRITFLIFPWAIPFALDWLRSHADYLLALLRNYAYLAFAISTFAIISGVILYFQLTDPELMRAYLADFKNGYWLVIGAINLSATLALAVALLRRNHSIELGQPFSDDSP